MRHRATNCSGVVSVGCAGDPVHHQNQSPVCSWNGRNTIGTDSPLTPSTTESRNEATRSSHSRNCPCRAPPGSTAATEPGAILCPYPPKVIGLAECQLMVVTAPMV